MFSSALLAASRRRVSFSNPGPPPAVRLLVLRRLGLQEVDAGRPNLRECPAEGVHRLPERGILVGRLHRSQSRGTGVHDRLVIRDREEGVRGVAVDPEYRTPPPSDLGYAVYRPPCAAPAGRYGVAILARMYRCRRQQPVYQRKQTRSA
jgi:hypothetical protein